MKWSCSLATLLMTLVTTAAVAQGQPSDPVGSSDVGDEIGRILDDSGVVAAVDSIARSSAPALQETLGQLATTLGDLAARVAADPELRRSAFSAAQGIAELTSSIVAENADALEEVLKKAADELDRMGGAKTPSGGSREPESLLPAAPAPQNAPSAF